MLSVFRGIVMKAIKGDLWKFYESGYTIGIPTNGFVKKNGRGVMGAGVALEAKKRFRSIDKRLGEHILTRGNVVGYIYENILSVPVKPKELILSENKDYDKVLPKVKHLYKLGDRVPGFHCLADLEIIESSLSQIISLNESIYIPLLGCGNGGLNFRQHLMPLLLSMNISHSITFVFNLKE